MAPKKGSIKTVEKNYDLSKLDLPFDISSLSEDGKIIVSVMSFFLNKMEEKFENKLKEKDTEILQLNTKINELELTIEKLDYRIEENETIERRNNLVFSGSEIPNFTPGEKCENLVSELLSRQLKLRLQPDDVISAQRIGNKPSTRTSEGFSSQVQDKRSILVKFSRNDCKKDILTSSRKVKPKDLFIRENLTTMRNSILFVLRKARREFPDIISGCSSIDGNVYAWVKPSIAGVGQRDNRHRVNTYKKLDTFCQTILSRAVSEFVEDWQF